MVRDVYAGDDPMGKSTGSPSLCQLSVLADPDPLVLCKVASHVALANVTPTRCFLEVTPDGDVRIEVDVWVASSHLADLMVRKLSQLTCVRETQAHFITESL